MTFNQVQENLRRNEGIRIGRVVLDHWTRFSEWTVSDGQRLTSYSDETSAIKAFLEAIA